MFPYMPSQSHASTAGPQLRTAKGFILVVLRLPHLGEGEDGDGGEQMICLSKNEKKKHFQAHFVFVFFAQESERGLARHGMRSVFWA